MHRRRRGRTLLVTMLVLLASAARVPIASSEPTPRDVASAASKAALAALADSVEAGAYGELHQLLVLRHGQTLLEASFHGWSPDSLHPMYSVTKSVTALLVGIAIEQGKLAGVEVPLADLLPEYSTILRADPRKAKIKLEHLLTMTAGFDWDERAAPYRDPRNPTTQLAASDDWIRFVLERPMIATPGKQFAYNSGVSILLGAVLERATSTRVADFAARNLFEPLSIEAVRWESGPRGLTNTGWGLGLGPRDLAKLGGLVLQGGRWQDHNVVSKAWIERATREHVEVRGRRRYGYGYQWWRMPASADPKGGAGVACFAWGFGDQFLFVLPRLDAIVVVTGGNFENFRGARRDPRDLLRDQLVPALQLEER